MEDLQIPVELMMEHAGLNLARLVSQREGKILIVVGSGNNGGGGLTCARRLLSWGRDITLFIPKGIDHLRKVPKKQFDRLSSFELEIVESPEQMSETINQFDICVDAFIGYGFKNKPDENAMTIFELMKKVKILICLDSPSGVNTSTGENYSGFNPEATCTIAYPKIGHLKDGINLGEFYLIDIGVPKWVFEKIVGKTDLLDTLYRKFEKGSLLKIVKGNNYFTP